MNPWSDCLAEVKVRGVSQSPEAGERLAVSPSPRDALFAGEHAAHSLSLGLGLSGWIHYPSGWIVSEKHRTHCDLRVFTRNPPVLLGVAGIVLRMKPSRADVFLVPWLVCWFPGATVRRL